ncbi:MAG: SDR family NAD(P)-dependent oxidoreductase [Pseudomonadota bacterium]|nr:SDR family NAD(P)-dependent oxidoreductase [Pseudomonadota bacterium]
MDVEIRINPKKFSGQVAIVTGAAQGIGFVTAKILAAQGATVVLADINAEKLRESSQCSCFDNCDVHTHIVDLSIDEQVAALTEKTFSQHGRVDILAHLAGIYPFFPYTLDHLSTSDWHRVLQVNLDSAFLLARFVLPCMRSQQYGRIINTSSIAVDVVGAPGLAAYTASKAGIIGFTRALAQDAGMDGITANVVMPGLVETEHTKAMRGDPAATEVAFDSYIARQCIKRRGQPEDIAHCIAYLASPEAGFVTGQTINVGGGYSF